jgi:hypothetical protein
MVIDSILAQIDAEISRLTQIRSLLTASGTVAAEKVTERKPRKVAAKVKAAAAIKKTKKKRTLSPEARARIAEAQRKRWAAQKAS